MRVVERRPDKIVHRRVDDDEMLVLALLQIDDRRDQRAGVADDQSARLQDHLAAERRRALGDDLGVLLRRGRRIVVVAIRNAEAAAEIDMLDRMPVGSQRLHELGEQRERVVERLKIGDLRADMHVDAVDARGPAGCGRRRRRRGRGRSARRTCSPTCRSRSWRGCARRRRD